MTPADYMLPLYGGNSEMYVSNYIMTSLTASGTEDHVGVLKSVMNSLIVYITLSEEEKFPRASEEDWHSCHRC